MGEESVTLKYVKCRVRENEKAKEKWRDKKLVRKKENRVNEQKDDKERIEEANTFLKI